MNRNFNIFINMYAWVIVRNHVGTMFRLSWKYCAICGLRCVLFFFFFVVCVEKDLQTNSCAVSMWRVKLLIFLYFHERNEKEKNSSFHHVLHFTPKNIFTLIWCKSLEKQLNILFSFRLRQIFFFCALRIFPTFFFIRLFIFLFCFNILFSRFCYII